MHRNQLFEILNTQVTVAYLVLLGSLLVNIWAMSCGLQLKELAMLESLGYIFVPLLSLIILKEKITKRCVTAICIIVFGLIVFYL